jgi:hypothetical protein
MVILPVAIVATFQQLAEHKIRMFMTLCIEDGPLENLQFAALCFFITMEEISWGQLELGVATPAGMARRSTQKEINIHNLRTIQESVICFILLVGWYGCFGSLARQRYRHAPSDAQTN